MDTTTLLSRQGHRLLHGGMALLLFTSFEGFFVPYFAVPQLGRSVHTLSALLAILLLVFGLVWPRLQLGARASRVAFWLVIYSGLAIVAAFVLAGVWGAGSSTMPLAAGNAQGSPLQEAIIMMVAYSSGPTGICAFALILWGLRLAASPSH
jgi:(hydroxyamino)benzene mutase